VRLEDLAAPGKPADDPETRLRGFLERIDRCIKAWGTPRWGHCAVCGEPIAPAVLDEVPWTERCPRHVERQI
jgi:RNA polymerase-binding transcription factor DksA